MGSYSYSTKWYSYSAQRYSVRWRASKCPRITRMMRIGRDDDWGWRASGISRRRGGTEGLCGGWRAGVGHGMTRIITEKGMRWWSSDDGQGCGTPRSRQILRARKSLSSRCRGIALVSSLAGLKYSVCREPSRSKTQPWVSRCRINSMRFIVTLGQTVLSIRPCQ
jgi:hypothetical protein